MSQMRTHLLEGRKREEWVSELQNVACHKRALTSWREGKGRSGLVSFEMWHVTNQDVNITIWHDMRSDELHANYG